MNKFEITSMSSRGQVVIPFDIREQMGLREGEKFAVIGKDDTVIFKKIVSPSFEGFDELLAKTQTFAKEKKLTEKDVTEAIKRARK